MSQKAFMICLPDAQDEDQRIICTEDVFLTKEHFKTLVKDQLALQRAFAPDSSICVHFRSEAIIIYTRHMKTGVKLGVTPTSDSIFVTFSAPAVTDLQIGNIRLVATAILPNKMNFEPEVKRKVNCIVSFFRFLYSKLTASR